MPFGFVACTFSDNLSRNSCIHILTRTVRKAPQCNIRQKQDLNFYLLCYCIKNQNWEMYCLLLQRFMTCRTIIFGISGLVKLVTLYILFRGGGAEGLGEGSVKITLIVSCLEWLTRLFLFIMVKFEKVIYSPNLTMVLIFLVTKVFQKGAMFK